MVGTIRDKGSYERPEWQKNQSLAKPKTNAIINKRKNVIKMKAKVYANVILIVEGDRGFSIDFRQTSVM